MIHAIVGAAIIAAILTLPSLIVMWLGRRVAIWRAMQRHPANTTIEADIADALDLADPGHYVVITRRVNHPVFGPCEQTWYEPHPASVAERILRESGAA